MRAPFPRSGRKEYRLDPERAAQFVVGSLVQCVLRRTVSDDPALLRYTPEQIAPAFVEMVLRGLQSAPADGADREREEAAR